MNTPNIVKKVISLLESKGHDCIMYNISKKCWSDVIKKNV